ncbi:hypothetical protein H1C71_040071, partial [Ictidomys tridecemlineatus]
YTYAAQFFISLVVYKARGHNSCLHTCTLDNDVYHIPPSLLTPCPLPFPPTPLPYLNFIYSSHALPPYPTMKQLPYIRENIWHLFFGDWLTSLSIIFSNAIHLFTCKCHEFILFYC